MAAKFRIRISFKADPVTDSGQLTKCLLSLLFKCVDLPLSSDFTVPLIDNRRSDLNGLCHKMNIFLKPAQRPYSGDFGTENASRKPPVIL